MSKKSKKRALSLLLALALCLCLFPASALALEYGEEYKDYVPTETTQYSDVPTTHWAYSSIETCSQRSWFNGYPDGTFRPEGYIRRDEAAKVFAVALGLTLEENPVVTYTDTADNWAKAYIEATKALFPNTTNLQGTASFRPDQNITREETIYALVVAWRYVSKTINADLSVLNMFSDVNSISAGVKPYMAVAVSEGLVSGLPDGTIAAQKGLTRAEFATLLARALSHGYGPDTTEAPSITLDKYSTQTTEEQAVLTGVVSPASGITLTLDGQAVSVDRTGAFRLSLDLEEGQNTFTLTAVNSYGVQTQKAVTVQRTPEAVSIRLLSTVPEETDQAQVSVNGLVVNWSSDCMLLLNDTRVNVDSEGYFETPLTLEAGGNAFSFTIIRQQQEIAAVTLRITRNVPAEPIPPTDSSGSEGNGTDTNPSTGTNPGTSANPGTDSNPDPGADTNPGTNPNPGTDANPGTGTNPGTNPNPGSSTPPVELEIDPNREVIKTGSCGANIKYVLYADGELVIVGAGKMNNYTGYPQNMGGSGSDAPWYDQESRIASVTISEGITSVGNSAFFGCSGLLKATLPSTITDIGDKAFAYSGLVRLNIPNSVKTIGEESFYCCNLSSVNIPNGVISIGSLAFARTNLTNVVLPATITNIKNSTFSDCRQLTSVTLPDSITGIANGAFGSCRNLKDVYYSGSVQQWEEVVIAEGNTYLTGASIHYNSTAP